MLSKPIAGVLKVVTDEAFYEIKERFDVIETVALEGVTLYWGNHPALGSLVLAEAMGSQMSIVYPFESQKRIC